MQRVPTGDPNQTPPELHGPNSNQIAQVGEVEVLNGPISFHVRGYLGFGVVSHIRQNWQHAVEEKGLAASGEQKTLAVEFTILKDGTLDSRRLAESSGDTELDRSGLDAVAKSAPFIAIPGEFSGQYLKLKCHFYLNPGRRIPAVSRATLTGESTDAADSTPTAGEGTIHGNGGPTRPQPIYSPSPEFSDEARKAKVGGSVLLKASVNADGDVADVIVLRSLGSGLDEKALEAVRRWKFKPGTKDGVPVATEINVEVSFHL